MKNYLRDGRSPIPKNEAISKVMSANKGKNTKPELLLRKQLWENGIKGYRINYKKVPGRPDLAFVSKKLAVFINGCFWHRCSRCNLSLPKTNQSFWENKFEKNIERDKTKRKELETLHWLVLEIWECEIKKDINKQIDKIRKTYYEQKA